MWFPMNLKGPMIPDPSGQLAELIVYITSTRVDLYSHQILLIYGFSPIDAFPKDVYVQCWLKYQNVSFISDNILKRCMFQ